MPYVIRKSGSRFKVVNRITGKSLPGSSKSKGMAEKRIRAVETKEHSGKRSSYHKR